LSTPPVLKQGNLEQAAQDHVQTALEYLQRQRPHSLSGYLNQCSVTLTVKKLRQKDETVSRLWHQDFSPKVRNSWRIMVSIHIGTNGGFFIGILEDMKQRRAKKMINSIYTKNNYNETYV